MHQDKDIWVFWPVQWDDSSDGTLFGTLAAGDGGHSITFASRDGTATRCDKCGTESFTKAKTLLGQLRALQTRS